MQLKPINATTSHLQYHWFPPHPQNRKPRQAGRRQTWLPLNGAKMVRRPAPEGGEQEANRPVHTQSSQPQLPDGRCSFETPTSMGLDEEAANR